MHMSTDAATVHVVETEYKFFSNRGAYWKGGTYWNKGSNRIIIMLLLTLLTVMHVMNSPFRLRTFIDGDPV